MLLNKSVRALQGHQCQAWGSASGLAAFPRQSTQASTSYTTRKSQLNAVVTTAAPASAASVVSVASTYLNEHKDLHALVEPKQFRSDLGDRLGLVARAELKEGQVILSVPESLALTQIDAEKQELVGEVAAASSELIALTLWLMAERSKGISSAYSKFLAMLPASVPTSPLLWGESQLSSLLSGSPVQAEARTRREELGKQWALLAEQHFGDSAKFSAAVFNESNFMACFSVVVAHVTYLPSAQCFALLPLAGLLRRTGDEVKGARLDYNADKGSVEVIASTTMKPGQELQIYDGRPNGELLLCTGMIEDGNPSDYTLFNASLVSADKYFSMKAQILEAMGLGPKETFPVYADRMPIQLFNYLRLARVADPALFAKIQFEQDVTLSQMNEYEILQILMGDCRERIAAYPYSLEEDLKMLQLRELGPVERCAAQLRLSELKLLNSAMDAVRQKLAPIRGIPTKSGGMQAPNSDLIEIFEMIDSIPSAPKKLMDGFMSWARGDDDPDWKKPKKR